MFLELNNQRNQLINIYLYLLNRKYLKNNYVFEIKFKTLIACQFLPFRMIDN